MPFVSNEEYVIRNILKENYKEELPRIIKMDTIFFPIPWSKESWTPLINGPASGYELFTICSHLGELRGFCLLYEGYDHSELYKIVVDLKWRGCGYASHLLSYALKFMRIRGMKRCLLEVSCQNRAAIHLYEKLGFVILTRKNHFYSNNDDAYTMALDLK